MFLFDPPENIRKSSFRMFSGRSRGNIGKKRVILKILVTTVLLKLGIFGFGKVRFEFGTSESLLYVTGTMKSLRVVVWKNFVISYLKFRWWKTHTISSTFQYAVILSETGVKRCIRNLSILNFPLFAINTLKSHDCRLCSPGLPAIRSNTVTVPLSRRPLIKLLNVI